MARSPLHSSLSSSSSARFAPRFAVVAASASSFSPSHVPMPRRSRRSFSGWVTVVRFRSPASAGAFARLWSGRVGVACVVRGLAVSVPCVPVGQVSFV